MSNRSRSTVGNLDPDLPLYEMLRMICIVQVQPRRYVLDHADYTAPTRQHELDRTDHTDHIDHTDQESICPERSR